MAKILVRDLEDGLVDHLKKRAASRGRSLQAEVKMILEQAANTPQADMETARKLVRRIRGRFKGRKFPDSAKLIREDRGR